MGKSKYSLLKIGWRATWYDGVSSPADGFDDIEMKVRKGKKKCQFHKHNFILQRVIYLNCYKCHYNIKMTGSL